MNNSLVQSMMMRAQGPDAELWLEALPAPVLGIDVNERICLANAAAMELFAYTGRSLLGRTLEEIFGVDAPATELVRRARKTAGVVESEVVMAGLGFTLGRVNAAAAPAGEGHVVLTIARASRSRPPAAEHSAARTLAHEVRNPLAGIRAAAQLIGRSGDDETAALAALICDEVDRINRLTRRIDPLGALAPQRFERFNVHEALERVRKLITSSAPAVTVLDRYDPSLPAIRGDLDQLIQAFLNIAKNACEAVADRTDGEVILATSYRPGVRFRSASDDAARAQLEVQIIDNGPGLDADIAERAFEAFATTKPDGMGLGLTVAASIIARHDGRIEVESALERTAFRILLPIDPENSP